MAQPAMGHCTCPVSVQEQLFCLRGCAACACEDMSLRCKFKTKGASVDACVFMRYPAKVVLGLHVNSHEGLTSWQLEGCSMFMNMQDWRLGRARTCLSRTMVANSFLACGHVNGTL